MQLDSIDLAILTVLQTDGRISNAALAEKVGLSLSAVLRRLRRVLAVSRTDCSLDAVW